MLTIIWVTRTEPWPFSVAKFVVKCLTLVCNSTLPARKCSVDFFFFFDVLFSLHDLVFHKLVPLMSDELNIEGVARDIELLYSSSNALEIHELQERLQTYQKSEIGYQLGFKLLENSNKNVKYFGALTITVFLNTHDSSVIFENCFNQVLGVLIELSTTDFTGNLFIIKKLISNLSLLYIMNSEVANFDPVFRLLSAILGSKDTAMSTMISQLQDEKQLELLLLFLLILAEDIIKLPTQSPKLHTLIHNTVFKYCSVLFEYLYNNLPSISTRIILLLLDCLSSWVVYISVAETNSEERYNDDVQVFLQYLLKQLDIETNINNMEILNKSFTLFTEIIDNVPRILSPLRSTIFDILFGKNKFGTRYTKLICTSQEFRETYSLEIENYVNLVISYLGLNLVLITRNINDINVVNIIQMTMALSSIPGIPTEDENVSEQFIVFWEDFTETYIDDAEEMKPQFTADQDQANFIAKRNEILLEVSRIFFKKVLYYPAATKEFRLYRNSVAELFGSLYSLMGVSLYSSICDLICFNLDQQDRTTETFQNLEAGLYLIYKITSDIYFHDDHEEDDFGKVTLTPLINEMFNKHLVSVVEGAPEFVTKQLQITLLNVMSVLPFFYRNEVGSQHLPATFNFLFNIILNGANETISLIASRTVYKICQDSEEKLIPFLPNLELILLEMLKNPNIDDTIRERMTHSYISIARATKNPVDWGNRVHGVLMEIESCYSGLNEELEAYAVSLISCISEMSNASLLPEDVEDYLTLEQLNIHKAYWIEDPLEIRSKVLKNLKLFSLETNMLSRNSIVTEKCCNVLKYGFREELPGPFTFSVDIVFEYLVAKVQNCNTQSIPIIHGLLETIIITSFKTINPDATEILLNSIFIEIYSTIVSDVDLVKSSLDLFTTILEKRPALLLQTPFFSDTIIPFAIQPLYLHEIFVVKSVTKFWNTAITLKKGNSNDHQQIKDIINSSIQNTTIGVLLIEALLSGFVLAPRSAIEYYFPLFRTLIARMPLEVKNWIRHVLLNSSMGKAPLDSKKSETFLNKLLLTRGQRQANDVLRDYWLQVNKLTNFIKYI